eukprot:gene4027-20197_t
MSEWPVYGWVISSEEGKVISGHCTCMAGHGETCSHVASILFYDEAAVRVRETATVTQEAAFWKLPSAKRPVLYAPGKEKDFTTASQIKRQLDADIESNVAAGSSSSVPIPIEVGKQIRYAMFQLLLE